MKIGIIGANGKAGSLILKEAVERGHEVTAIVRNATKVENQNVKIIEKDIFELKADDIKAFDVVVNAFGAPPEKSNLHIEAGKALFEEFKVAINTRLLYVGGAASLYVDEAKTVKLLETPDFPEAYKPTASAMLKNFENLEKTIGIQWTYLCPAGFFDPNGKRTGSYKTRKDILVLNSKGESYISYADYAIAMLDEIENPKYENAKVSVVGEN
ncbi:hypothetical protein CLPUN_37200 [Clostridium puniceum]|uniref:NAD(P)-binding domain-containing protein n=1 Tax=Clostridium puniceum TaxID=29367 RepID=A0A1S8TAK0_9CLOT|nr:NAD(P)-dependent oxidoreductase [Clostridium puniceum]OOM74702.1 hypothetical protein CLPUN_37200 [Clostridium puniceum]